MKKIDISTQEGLDLLKTKAKYYGHYTEQLQVLELIQEIERLKKDSLNKSMDALALETESLGLEFK